MQSKGSVATIIVEIGRTEAGNTFGLPSFGQLEAELPRDTTAGFCGSLVVVSIYRKILCRVAIWVVLVFGVCLPSMPLANYATASFQGRTSAPLRISHDLGGNVIEYMRAVTRARQAGRRVEISGRCYSACTLFLSLPASQVCMRGSVSFGFHRASGSSPDMNRWATNMLWNSYPDWVQKWLTAQGGMKRDIVRMPVRNAAQRIPKCGPRMRRG